MFAMQTGYAAIDDIKFMDCAFPRKIGACNRLQTRCDNGACINPEKVSGCCWLYSFNGLSYGYSHGKHLQIKLKRLRKV